MSDKRRLDNTYDINTLFSGIQNVKRLPLRGYAHDSLEDVGNSRG